MVHGHQADGLGVGGERRKGFRNKMKAKRKMIWTSTSMLLLLLSNYHYRKNTTYLFTLFVSLSH